MRLIYFVCLFILFSLFTTSFGHAESGPVDHGDPSAVDGTLPNSTGQTIHEDLSFMEGESPTENTPPANSQINRNIYETNYNPDANDPRGDQIAPITTDKIPQQQHYQAAPDNHIDPIQRYAEENKTPDNSPANSQINHDPRGDQIRPITTDTPPQQPHYQTAPDNYIDPIQRYAEENKTPDNSPANSQINHDPRGDQIRPITTDSSTTQRTIASSPDIDISAKIEECRKHISNSEAFSECLQTTCLVNSGRGRTVDRNCWSQGQAEIQRVQTTLSNLEAAHNQCSSGGKDNIGLYKNAQLCCSEDLAENECISDSKQVMVNGVKQITQTMQMAAQLASPAAICQANKKAFQISSALLLTGTALCNKEAWKCHSKCGVSEFSGRSSCEAMLGSNSEAYISCKEKVDEMKSHRNSCYLLQAESALKAGLQGKIASYQKKFQQCGETLTAGNGEPDCTDPEQQQTRPECAPTVCSQPGSENLAICNNYDPNNGNSPVADATGNEFDFPSNGDGAGADSTTEGGNSAFGDPDETFNPNANFAAKTTPSSGASGRSGGGSGSGAPSLGSMGGSGGGSKGRGRRTASGKSRNIIKGTSSGNGYVSRFRGSGGSGGYRSRGRSGRSVASVGVRAPRFNLKKFLPKSKKITKGRLKGYTRLPSGNLMVPQQMDIFEVHHASYKNACTRRKIIKGCGPAASKALGHPPTLKQLNSRYKAQLSLQKEARQQRLSRSGLKVQTLQNHLGQQARQTYYQIKYLNKYKLRRLPVKSSITKADKNHDWAKMQAWVHSQSHKTPTKAAKPNRIRRLPASRK